MTTLTSKREIFRDYILAVLAIEKNNIDSDYIEHYLKMLDLANKAIKNEKNCMWEKLK